ncbi:MAG: hypothetical protein EHV01_004835 [Spiroplasma sp. hy2]|uniref:hypothetical protein n=1 Tax=Spiroplasma sp. hy2 TaxID=2490850 RepID=UPI003B69AB2B
MKLDQNICIVPHCKEIQLLLERGCVFCIEHRKRFDEYIDNLPFIPELHEYLENNNEAHFLFLLKNLSDFFEKLEKEWHKNNTSPIKKKKPKKKSNKRKRK